MPTAAYNPGLLREQETPLVIGKNWFLDQEISAGGFCQNLRLATAMGRANRRNENHHDRMSENMLGPRTRMDNHYRGMEVPKKQECWEDHDQALITIIRKETKRTEELGGSWI